MGLTPQHLAEGRDRAIQFGDGIFSSFDDLHAKAREHTDHARAKGDGAFDDRLPFAFVFALVIKFAVGIPFLVNDAPAFAILHPPQGIVDGAVALVIAVVVAWDSVRDAKAFEVFFGV